MCIRDSDEVAFNLSVGYDLAGIKDSKVDGYIEGMIDASQTPIWKECYAWVEANLGEFTHFTADDLANLCLLYTSLPGWPSCWAWWSGPSSATCSPRP